MTLERRFFLLKVTIFIGPLEILRISCLVSGRLYQVEYAMEAISHAGSCLGILASDGILLAAEKRNVHKLLDEEVFAEKIYPLHEYVTRTAVRILGF